MFVNPNLSLNASGSVTACELFDFGNADAVEVTLDGMLECGSCNCKFDRLLRSLALEKGIDQTGTEGVTAADTVNNVQMVGLGEAVVLAVIEHTCPVVVGCGYGCTEGDGDLFKAELVSQLLCNGLVTLVVELTAVDVGSFCFDAEDILCVFFVGDADIDVLSLLSH